MHQHDTNDIINHPNHYTAGGIEVIDVIRAKLTPEQFEGYLLGTQIAYLLRANFKGQYVADVNKANVYSRWLSELPRPTPPRAVEREPKRMVPRDVRMTPLSSGGTEGDANCVGGGGAVFRKE